MNRKEWMEKEREHRRNAGDNEAIAYNWLSKDSSVTPPTKGELRNLGVNVDE